ncbi:radical SAM family heme chaperone HemW [Prevotella pallens]|jgi:putative coproporphyrinogen dehydrogenase|uniref:radical SAM family heme chaperone HemW n=1 Tax=Prevotella pallens TaxID=60133 RepID=UPI0028EE15ED|nr:radical SAM family heme chaperone HemW [Prevotella pallens]
MAGLYFHIPFCASRCIYCGFYSTITPHAEKANTMNLYVDALCKEAITEKNYLFGEYSNTAERIETIYFGGGTPSQLQACHIEKIFRCIADNYADRMLNYSDMEISLECNPDDITPEFAENLRHLPINRVSMGAQTFSDERLKFLRRRHKASDVRTAIERLRRVGIENISIDLMFGFPNETIEQWQRNIDKAIALNVEHLSAYSLMYEEGTPLYQLLQKGKVKDMDEELYRTMYDTLIDRLALANYEQYEISNFAKLAHTAVSPFRSRHNSAYWANKPYLGIGASAHSYNLSTRRWNIDNLQEYIDGITNNRPIYEVENIDANTHYDDMVTTALRTKNGIDLSTLPSPYKEHIAKASAPLVSQGLLAITDNHLHLTRNGIYVSDFVMSELMYV